jgi:hypothetical protein
MSRFHPKPPRTAVGIAAIALCALTFGLAVVAPAAMDSRTVELRVLAREAAAASGPAIPRLRIEVVGIRTPEVATSQDRNGAGRNVPQS